MTIAVLTDSVITVAGVDLSSYVQQVTLSEQVDEVDITTFGSGGRRERAAGLIDGQVSIEFFQSFDAGATNATIRPVIGDNDVTITLKATSAATSATNPLYTFDVLVTDWETLNAAVGEASSTSVTWPISGSVTESTS